MTHTEKDILMKDVKGLKSMRADTLVGIMNQKKILYIIQNLLIVGVIYLYIFTRDEMSVNLKMSSDEIFNGKYPSQT